MEQKVITARSARELNSKIEDMIADGWEPVGGHTMTVEDEYAQYAGSQYRRTIRVHEFQQTMRKL